MHKVDKSRKGPEGKNLVGKICYVGASIKYLYDDDPDIGLVTSFDEDNGYWTLDRYWKYARPVKPDDPRLWGNEE